MATGPCGRRIDLRGSIEFKPRLGIDILSVEVERRERLASLGFVLATEGRRVHG
jgi:hypothetical protein